MTYGTFMAVLQLIGQVQLPFANISGFLPRTYAMLASAERLLAVESLAASDEGTVRSQEEVQNQEERSTKEGRPVVVHGLDLEVCKGQYLSFEGDSRCGKSTVLKLLLCLYPLDEGERYLVCGGRKMPLDSSWQRLFMYPKETT